MMNVEFESEQVDTSIIVQTTLVYFVTKYHMINQYHQNVWYNKFATKIKLIIDHPYQCHSQQKYTEKCRLMDNDLRESCLLTSTGRGRVFTQFFTHKFTLLRIYFAFGFLSGGAYALFSICAKDNRGHGRPTRKAQSPRLMNGGRPSDMTLSDALKGSLSFSSSHSVLSSAAVMQISTKMQLSSGRRRGGRTGGAPIYLSCPLS